MNPFVPSAEKKEVPAGDDEEPLLPVDGPRESAYFDEVQCTIKIHVQIETVHEYQPKNVNH